MLDTLQPATDLKVWNTSPNVRYGQETVQLHFNSPSEIQRTVRQSLYIYTEKMNKGSYFTQKEQSKEK